MWFIRLFNSFRLKRRTWSLCGLKPGIMVFYKEICLQSWLTALICQANRRLICFAAWCLFSAMMYLILAGLLSQIHTWLLLLISMKQTRSKDLLSIRFCKIARGEVRFLTLMCSYSLITLHKIHVSMACPSTSHNRRQCSRASNHVNWSIQEKIETV